MSDSVAAAGEMLTEREKDCTITDDDEKLTINELERVVRVARSLLAVAEPLLRAKKQAQRALRQSNT